MKFDELWGEVVGGGELGLYSKVSEGQGEVVNALLKSRA